MDFHLEFPVQPFPRDISYTDKLFFTGSCFSENISTLFSRHKFNTFTNPNGIVYDPLSIARSLSRVVKKELFSAAELFLHNESWRSWEHHSSFSSVDQNSCLEQMNAKLVEAHVYSKDCAFLFITFGSAYVYRHKNSGKRVANCHKVDQKEFQKELLSVDDIVAAFKALEAELRVVNPNVKVIYTVSPVRYIRDGVVENTLGKSVLIQAVHQLVKASERSNYFPAYELVMDDLRDYRFFKSDMVHPNDQAIHYVFDKLCKATFTEETLKLFGQIRQIMSAVDHKPFGEATTAHKKFKETALKKCIVLQEANPGLDLSAEIEYFKN